MIAMIKHTTTSI